MNQFITDQADSGLEVTASGSIDTLDISTAESGAILVTTSENEIKILNSNGALSESIRIDKRVKMAKFAPESDQIAIFAFTKAAGSSGESSSDGSVAQVWDL